MRRGFTLLELVVVIIILGILATLGMTQYGKMVEKSRGAEAKQIFGNIRQLASAFYLENNQLTATAQYPAGFDNNAASIGVNNDQIPSACRATHFFSYALNPAPTATVLGITATRCGAAGKGGASPAANRTLTLTTTFPAGTDVWGGDGGY